MNMRQVVVSALVYVVAFTLILMGALGLLVISGAKPGGYDAVVPGVTVMLVLAGGGLFCNVRDYRRAARLIGSLLAAIATWYLWKNGQGSLPRNPSASFCIGLTLLGCAAIVGNESCAARRIGMAAASAAFILAALSAAALWTPSLAPFYLGSPALAGTREMLLGLGAIASFLLAWMPPAREASRLPARLLLASLGGVLVYVLSWFILTAQEYDLERDQSATAMHSLQQLLMHTVDRQLALVDRMAGRWAAASAFPSDTLWEAETTSYIHDIPGLELLAVLDAAHRVVRVQAPALSERGWLQDYLSSENASAWLAGVQQENQARMSASYTDRGGVSRNLIAVALQSPELKGWTLVAAQNLPVLLKREIGSSLDGDVRISEGSRLLFGSGAGAFAGQPVRVSAAAAVPIHPELQWDVELLRSHNSFDGNTPLANALLLTGLIFMVFLKVSGRLSFQARRDADHVALQRDTMALIARTEDVSVMLAAICTMVEKREPDAVCTIHSLSEDGKTLKLLAAPTLPLVLRDRFTTVAVAEGVGSCGTSAHRGKPVIVPDVTVDPLWQDHQQALVEQGLQACFSHPVLSTQGNVLGTVAIYLPRAGEPSVEQANLLESTAQFAAVAMERARARIQIRASEQRYRSLYAFNPDSVFSLDRTGCFTSMNPVGQRLSGYSETQLLGQPYTALVVPQDAAAAQQHIQAALAGQAERYQIRGLGRQGRIFDLDITSMPIEIHGEFVGVFGIAKDVTERNEILRALNDRNQQLAHNAHHDQLTGLPNRRLLEIRLREAAARARPDGHGVGVVFFDLDGFKPINDSMGHAVGDQMLMEVAHRMQAYVRTQDTVSRLSGDEFVMVLHGLTAEQAERITQRTINALAQPYELPLGVQHITSSAGIAFTEAPVDDPMALVQAADLAMYKAKHEGKNNYQWHTEDMSRKVKDRVRMRNELQHALETGALAMHYQPKFDRSTTRIVGVEALARWNQPEQGPVPPTEFIAIAEETGQIVTLGNWALETACAHHQWLLTQELSDFGVSVNISAVQFQRRNFVQDVHSVLMRTGLPAHYLELEITETVLLKNTEQVIKTFNELKTLGVRVSIDDFGTGFSSLSYLKHLPIDKMKIDRSFVSDVTKSPDDAAIARTIISMAHNLGIKVVAEGVESQDQLEFLLNNACDEFQGYLLAVPMSLDVLVHFLEDRRALGRAEK